jgi:hypothetical protein
LHSPEPFAERGRVTPAASLCAEEFYPGLLIVIEKQRLTQSRRGNGLPLPDAGAQVDPPLAGNLIEIQHLFAVEHAQVHGVFCQERQLLELRGRDAGQVELVAHPETQLEKLGPKAVTATVYECQVAAIGEGRGQPMCRTPREFQPVGQFAERDRTCGYELDNIEPAE